jgi:hypothetical protein
VEESKKGYRVKTDAVKQVSFVGAENGRHPTPERRRYTRWLFIGGMIYCLWFVNILWYG